MTNEREDVSRQDQAVTSTESANERREQLSMTRRDAFEAETIQGLNLSPPSAANFAAIIRDAMAKAGRFA